MQALTFTRPGVVEHTTLSEPAVIEPHDVIVEVEVAAICGSDLHVYRGNERGLDPGTVLGHELLGRIVDAGPDARQLIGERVVAAFSTSCGICYFCRRELTARCEIGQLLGWIEGGTGLHGAQAEFVRIPLATTSVRPVPETLEAVAALFAGDILSTGLFAATSGGVAAGDAVAVVGCGPVGLMCTAAALDAGAAVVWAIDMVEPRLELARRFGAVPLRLDASPVAVVGDATEGRGADVVLEAVGSPEATRLAYDLIRPGGTIAAAGVHTEQALAFSPGEAYDKNLTYRAGRCSAAVFMPRAFEIALRGHYPLSAVISHEMPLADGPRGYDMFDRKLDNCTKVLLRP